LSSKASNLTMAPSTSITKLPRFWKNCASSRPNHARARAMTTPWPRVKMPVWSGNIWSTATSRKSTPSRSIRYQEVFNPWLNLHRPCMFATSKVNCKGKVVKVYKHADVKTPLEALVKLNEMGQVRFKTDSMLADLLAKARQQTDLV